MTDMFRGKSRSPNMVPFRMLGTVSYWCEIVFKTIVFKTRSFFPIIQLQKCCDLEIQVRGYSRSLKVVPFDRLCMVSY